MRKKTRKKLERKLLKLMQDPRCTAVYTIGHTRGERISRDRCIVRDEERPHLWISYYYFRLGASVYMPIKISCFCRKKFTNRVVGLGRAISLTPAKLAREAAFHSSAEDRTEVIAWF